MRVMQIARYGGVRGGAETYVHTLSGALRAAGNEVATVVGLDADESRFSPELRFIVPGLVGGGDRAADEDVRALEAALAAFPPDVIHVHTPEVGWLAPWCAARAPTLLAVHDHKLDSPAGTKYWAAWHKACTIKPGARCLIYNVVAHCGSLRANATLRPYHSWRTSNRAARAMRIQVFSSYMRKVVAASGIDEGAIGVTPYPVPPRADVLPPSDRDERPVVLASGRLNKEKGFHQLLDAIARVKTPVHLVIAGSGHERDALETRARKIYGPHRITFTGWLSPEDLAGWTERAAIVAMPSMWPEPFGIAGLEAMARARPVVAFDSGGISEWLVAGETGTLVRHGDVIGFARALTELLDDSDARERMGAAGRHRVERDFSIEGHLERVLELYREVAG